MVVILCTIGGGKTSQREEESITARIEELIGEKGLIFWWNRSSKTKRSVFRRSQPLPASAGSIEMPTKGELSTHAERPINPKDFTLVLKTRLHRGRISYDESDVRLEGWRACEKMEDNLLREWQSTNIAELLVFRENKSGNERTVVFKDFEARLKGSGERIKDLLESFGLITRTGGSVTGTSVISLTDTSANVAGTRVTGLANAGAQVIGAGVSGFANARAQAIGTGVSGFANAGAQTIGTRVAGLANVGVKVVGTGVAGLANIGANVVGTGLSTIGSMLSSSDSPSEAGTNSSPGDYDLILDCD